MISGQKWSNLLSVHLLSFIPLRYNNKVLNENVDKFDGISYLHMTMLAV